MDDKYKCNREENQLEGRYANYFQIAHNAFEFLFDFAQAYDQDTVAAERKPPHTRIVTSPVYAKTLLLTLQAAINQYEKTFGFISYNDEQRAGSDGDENGS